MARASSACATRRTEPNDKAQCKAAALRDLHAGLDRSRAQTLANLVAATGWLPHTTRAALTRLRQAGHVLEKIRGETGTVYRIATPTRAVRSRKAA